MALIIGAFCTVAFAYELYGHITGRACFRVGELCGWLLGYGRMFTSELTDGSRSPAYTLFSFLIQSLSPLRQEQLTHTPASLLRAHLILAYAFICSVAVLIAGALRRIGGKLISLMSLQGLACWIVAYLAYHIFYSPWSAILFAPPLVLPLFLIVMPGIVTAWTARRYGAWVLALAALTMLANNLMTINEARIAWQRPGILQSPADSIYLIPGEIERVLFLTRKSLLLLTSAERDRHSALEARPRSLLTQEELLELERLSQRAYGHLSDTERMEIADTRWRFQEAVRLASGGQR